MTEEVFAGIDLHSNNVMIGIVDESGRRLKRAEARLRSQRDSGLSGAVEASAEERGRGIYLQLVLAGGWTARFILPNQTG